MHQRAVSYISIEDIDILVEASRIKQNPILPDYSNPEFRLYSFRSITAITQLKSTGTVLHLSMQFLSDA